MIRQRKIYTFIFALSISLIAALPTCAQKSKTVEQTDSIPWFNGVQVSADLAGVGMLLLSDYGHYEGALRVDLKGRWFPVVELGVGKALSDNEQSGVHYETSAPYGRIGMDWNIINDKTLGCRVFVGPRLAYTRFKYTTTSTFPDPVWGSTVNYGVTDEAANWLWAEANFGIDAKIWGPLHLGWALRYCLKLKGNQGSMGKAWYIPGYGTSDGSSIGAHFFVSLEI